MNARPFEMYRTYDDTGALLYIGISLSALMRLSQHRDKHWWSEVTQVSIERLSTTDRHEALRCEQEAIRIERPLHNFMARVIGRTPSPNKVMLAPGDVALMLGVSTQTVVRWGAEGWFGKITMTKGGQRRYRREAIEAFAATRHEAVA